MSLQAVLDNRNADNTCQKDIYTACRDLYVQFALAVINFDDEDYSDIERRLNALVVASGTEKECITGEELETLYRETYVSAYNKNMGYPKEDNRAEEDYNPTNLEITKLHAPKAWIVRIACASASYFAQTAKAFYRWQVEHCESL